jgi:hypothetical protein
MLAQATPSLRINHKDGFAFDRLILLLHHGSHAALQQQFQLEVCACNLKPSLDVADRHGR